MPEKWATDKLPRFEAAIRRLAEQHGNLRDEPLHLAIVYLPRRQGQVADQGIFLFEVIGGVADRFGQDDDLFEATVDASPGLPTGFDEPLHMVLTTPREMERALNAHWPLAAEVVDAIRRGDYEVLFKDNTGTGERVFGQLRSAATGANGPVGATRG